jgi:hypothetical protein
VPAVATWRQDRARISRFVRFFAFCVVSRRQNDPIRGAQRALFLRILSPCGDSASSLRDRIAADRLCVVDRENLAPYRRGKFRR